MHRLSSIWPENLFGLRDNSDYAEFNVIIKIIPSSHIKFTISAIPVNSLYSDDSDDYYYEDEDDSDYDEDDDMFGIRGGSRTRYHSSRGG